MNRKKLVALIMVLALAFTTLVGGTLAYFTDTDDATNTFTAGNVEIDLTEAVVEQDDEGNLVPVDVENDRNDVLEDEEEVYDYGKLYPGMTVFKDPTIENLGSENVYIAAVVTVTDGEGDLEAIIGTGYEGLIDINKVISGGFVQENAQMKTDHELHGLNNLPVYGDDTYSIYQEVVDEDTYKFYFFVEDEKVTGEKVVLFDTITVPEDWDNAEMKELVDLKIKVEAYATQAYGFDSCYEAMTAAFEGVFPVVV